MNLKTETLGTATILCASGNLDAAGAPGFEEQGRNLLRGGAQRLVLDLADVEYISSAGLRSLLVLAKTAKSAGGAMALCGLAPAVRETMTISGFDHILALAADRAAALDLLK